MERFYMILLQLYKEHGENMSALSRFLEIDKATVRKWVHREAVPRLDNVEHVLRKIEMPPKEIEKVKDGLIVLTDFCEEEVVHYGSTKALLEENARLRKALRDIRDKADHSIRTVEI